MHFRHRKLTLRERDHFRIATVGDLVQSVISVWRERGRPYGYARHEPKTLRFFLPVA
jgi:hypothetical protein